MGSKAKYARELLAIMLENRSPNQYYVEPFMGGCNVIDKVSGNRIGNDSNRYLVALLREIAGGWVPPPHISEDFYNEVKENREGFDEHLVGFVGFCSTYAGRWFRGYARGKSNDGTPRNYVAERQRNLLKQAPNLLGIDFYSVDYQTLSIPPKSIIYCDPPYAATERYHDHFDHSAFWKWCDKQVIAGHQVFVSEYSAPEDWECVWQKTVNSSLTTNTGGKLATEKLFSKTYSNQQLSFLL